MGIALLLMDYQECMCRPDGRVGRSGLAAEVVRRDVLDHASAALGAFRDHGLPVLHVRVAFDAGYTRMTSASPRFARFRADRMLLESDPETAICAEVAPRTDEPVIDKGCVNPFTGTRLTALLTRRGIDHLWLGGVATDQVVESTARVGADSGYRVTVLTDLCAAATDARHAYSTAEILPGYGEVTDSGTALPTLGIDRRTEVDQD